MKKSPTVIKILKCFQVCWILNVYVFYYRSKVPEQPVVTMKDANFTQRTSYKERWNGKEVNTALRSVCTLPSFSPPHMKHLPREHHFIHSLWCHLGNGGHQNGATCPGPPVRHWLIGIPLLGVFQRHQVGDDLGDKLRHSYKYHLYSWT